MNDSMNKVRVRAQRAERARYTPACRYGKITNVETTPASLQDGNPISFLLPPSRSGRGLDNLSCNRGGGISLSRQRTPLIERFWPKVDKNGPVPSHRPELGRCWLWTPAPVRYGMFWTGDPYNRRISAHRTSLLVAEYEATGIWPPLPFGYEPVIDHLCKTPACVNPAHLEWVDQSENNRRSSLPQVNRQKADSLTECKRGHPLTPENKIFYGANWRCRICKTEGAKERGQRRRALQKIRKEATVQQSPATAAAIGTS